LYIENKEYTYFIKKPKIKISLMCKYIYLSEEERLRMSESKLEYLIEKYNYNGCYVYSKDSYLYVSNNVIIKRKIDIQDPIKFLVWYIKFYDETTQLPIDIIDWMKYGYNVRDINGIINKKNIIKGIVLRFNGIDKDAVLEQNYYNNVVQYKTNIASMEEGEFIYTFSLYPKMYQPTGTCDFSMLADIEMIITLSNEVSQLIINNPNIKMKTEMWGVSYNTFRCMSGMGGLGFYQSTKTIF